jgi:hypothetical protein
MTIYRAKATCQILHLSQRNYHLPCKNYELGLQFSVANAENTANNDLRHIMLATAMRACVQASVVVTLRLRVQTTAVSVCVYTKSQFCTLHRLLLVYQCNCYCVQ